MGKKKRSADSPKASQKPAKKQKRNSVENASTIEKNKTSKVLAKSAKKTSSDKSDTKVPTKKRVATSPGESSQKPAKLAKRKSMESPSSSKKKKSKNLFKVSK